MLEITRLQPDPTSDLGPQPTIGWAARQQCAFLGAVLLALGLIGAGLVVWNWPPAPPPATPEWARGHIQSLTLLQTVHEWVDLMRGLEARPRRDERTYRVEVAWAWRWLYVATGIAAVGLATIAYGLLATGAARARAAQGR